MPKKRQLFIYDNRINLDLYGLRTIKRDIFMTCTYKENLP